MGLRCLIGHDYGEPQTSRDRSQRGNEVVVTVSEYRECSRCGHRRILSENKEVTADPTGTAADEASGEASWSEPEPEAGTDEEPAAEAFARSSVGASTGGQEEPMTAAEDDGIILEDEPETPPGRAHGAWPEADQAEPEEADDVTEEHEPWPDEQGPEEPEEPDRPDPGEDPLDAGPEPTAGSAATEADAPAEGSISEPEPTPRPDDRNTEFVCPDCGETWPSRNASLRPGDICPACRKGYLDERVVQ